MQRIHMTLLVFLASGAALSCGTGTPGDGGATVHFAATVVDGCQRVPGEARKVPADVDRVVVVARDGEGNEVASAVATAADLAQDAAVLLAGVPPGTVRVQTAGCQGPKATWWGEDPAVEVAESRKSMPVVFLLPVDGLACVGGANRNPLAPAFQGDDFLVQGRTAFAAGAAGPGGQAWLAGGASDMGLDGRLKGGRGLWRYLPSSGLFLAARNPRGDRLALAEGRLGHGVAFLSGGAMAVFGGASEALVAPQGFPGNRPPLLPDLAVQAAVEIVDPQQGTAVPVPGVQAPRWPAVAADAATGGTARALALAGGLGSGGEPSDAVVWIDASDPAAVAAGAHVSATLSRPRYGGTARFLSTGDLLLVGGWDGASAAAPELVRAQGTGLAVKALAAGYPPADGAASAFPALAVLQDDGQRARVLVAGGNPLGKAGAWTNPDWFARQRARAAWILTLTDADDDGAYDFAEAEIETLPTEEDPWTVRAFASLVPFQAAGSAGAPRFLAAGGYRSFSGLSDVEDCRDASGAGLDWCFPSTMAAFAPAGAGLGTDWTAAETGRLGATVVPLDGSTVLVAGGLSRFGGADPASWLESSGVVAFAGGAGPDAACRDHPAP